MHAQEKWMHVVLVLFLFLGSAGLTYWLVKDERIPELVYLSRGETNTESPLHAPDQQSRSGDGQALPPKLQADAMLVRLFDGEDGQVHTLPVTNVPQSFIGKSKEEIVRSNPKWYVLDLQPDRLTVKVELGEAALATGTRYLGIYDGKVAIFRGNPGVVSQLERVTDIPVEWLPEYEQENLRKGYVFAEQELEMILESLAEAAEAGRTEEKIP